MLALFCRRRLRTSCRDSRTLLSLLHYQFFNPFSSVASSRLQPSLTLDYLIGSCGLSPEKALEASNSIKLEDTSGPDSIVQCLKNYGFTQTHIQRLISSWPRVLSAKEATLQPKLQFIRDFGVSASDLPDLVVQNPYSISRCLKTQVVPSFQFLKGFLHAPENVVKALKRSGWLLTSDLEKKMLPNINLMTERGITASRIALVIMTQPRILTQRIETLEETIRRVEELGFKGGSPFFVLAIHAISSMSKSTWNTKFELFKSLGWSEEQILVGFRRMPVFLTCSEKKIKRGMDYFINQLNLTPEDISKNPKLLMHSMEKRIVPRCRVWRILRSQDIVKGKEELIRMWHFSDEDFLKRYVHRYDNEIPHLIKAFKGELEFTWLTSSKAKVEVC
ncbi:transcription termination factor MTERF4, chloroplastic-like [Aristolochia californica]|uniref:transcription termination factor MTERF4, chloroplastic-like n=1 Tax=Aristolochia californica TaxID=171875 RepID=UPI0035D6273D